MNWDWRSIKPGWYVLLFFVLYSLVATAVLQVRNRTIRDLQQGQMPVSVVTDAEESRSYSAPQGLWFPIPGAQLPQDNFYLPNARRDYRLGVNQGFNFYGSDAGIPIIMGTPVIASADAVIVRLDRDYQELNPEAWENLLLRVGSEGASEEELDLLRGRQVWLESEDGWIFRYAHLARIPEQLRIGQSVYRGQVIGYAGNSGTEDAVQSRERGVRLHFELWTPDGRYFGQDFDSPLALREAAGRLFVGP